MLFIAENKLLVHQGKQLLACPAMKKIRSQVKLSTFALNIDFGI